MSLLGIMVEGWGAGRMREREVERGSEISTYSYVWEASTSKW
jgi:hypothetical protein